MISHNLKSLFPQGLFLLLLLTTACSEEIEMNAYDFFPYKDGERITFINDDSSSTTLHIEETNCLDSGKQFTISEHQNNIKVHQIVIQIKETNIDVLSEEIVNNPSMYFYLPLYVYKPPLSNGKKISKYTIIKGFEKIRLRSNKNVYALKIEGRNSDYYLTFLTYKWRELWWAPGLGMVRCDLYEKGDFTGKEVIENSIEVRWDDVATSERLKRYNDFVETLPKKVKNMKAKDPIPIRTN